jgi:hypothetical protein
MTEIRNKRMMAALNMEKPDRIPINLSGLGFFKFIDPTAVLADYFRRPKYIDDLLIQAAQLPIIDEIDQAPMVGFTTEAGQTAFAAMYFAKIKLPGRELAEDALWNIDEQGPMTEEDYDTVLDKGWGYMTAELNKRIGFDPASLPPPDMEYMGELMQKVAALGKASIGMGGLLPFPSFEVLSGARKLPQFFKDLRRMPDKVRAVLEIMEDYAVDETIKALKSGPPAVYGFIGGTRAGCDFISPKVFEKFHFPFYRKVIPAMQKINVKSWLHQDSDWGAFLHYFREFDKAQCIWDPDQMTGMAKIKEVLGDKMCIEGDVPPGLLAVGTPDECYKYAKDLCDLMGDTGFIMSAGCSVPPNAKRENIEAVILATLGK